MTIIKILHFPWIEQIICLTVSDMAANSAPPKYQVQCMPPLPINPEKRESPYFCEVVGANHWGRKTEQGRDGARGARGSDGNEARGGNGNGATATATEREARGNESVRVRERLSESERERLRVRGNEGELCVLNLVFCVPFQLSFQVRTMMDMYLKETEYNGLGFL